jgi:hypothetical protein
MCAKNIAQHILLPANSILICFNRQNDTRINKVSDEVFEIPIRCAFKINFPRANTQKSYIANVCIMASYAKYYGLVLSTNANSNAILNEILSLALSFSLFLDITSCKYECTNSII